MAAVSNPLRSSGLVFEMAKRPDLQGMRALAVLAVFAEHLFEWPTGGFVGVDVFFVLSGFFITGLLLRERSSSRRLSFTNFYVRRVKRILPSALLVLTVTATAAHFLFPSARAKDTVLDALYASVFAANWRFQAIGADYFQQNQPPSPIQHYWSLSIEEQFYLVWPVLLVAIFALTRAARRRGQHWLRHWGLFGTMFVVVGASFAWAMHQSVRDANAAYFSTLTRVWELGVGALLAIAGPWLATIPSKIRPALSYGGLVGVVVSLFVIDSTMQFPAPWAALPVLSTALVVASFHGAEVRMPVLTNPVSCWFGDRSYTLYLWHWPVIILLLTLLPAGPLFYICAVAFSLGLTAVTYHFYEDPIRKSGWLTSHARAGLTFWTLGGAVLASVIVTALVAIPRQEMLSAVQQEVQAAQTVVAVPPPHVGPITESSASILAPLTSPLPGNGPCFGAPAMLDKNCSLRNNGVPLTPGIDAFTTDRTTPGLGCWAEKREKFKACRRGYQGGDATRIALVGDSHAALLLVALTPYLDAMKWQITVYTGWGCSWQQPAQEECSEAMAEMDKQMLAHPYDLVLTTSRRRNPDSNPAHYAEAWKLAVDAGSRVVAIGDNPDVSDKALACLSRVNAKETIGECGMPKSQALRARDPLVAAAGMVPGSILIDLTQYYCNEDRCPAVIGDVIVYSDTNHLTATYMRTLGPAIVDGIRQALARKAP